jgi:4-hydroxy-3-polyprenylbenzoate decarboxylase
MVKSKIIVAITGASGSIYGKMLLERLNTLSNEVEDVAVIFTKMGLEVWNYEIGQGQLTNIPYRTYSYTDFYAPFASGSSDYNTMIICPCSMGTLGRIANGVSDDLVTRSADVILKERRKLIIVPREAPYNLIHINNLKTLTEAGAIICPASPSFYSKPKTIEDVVNTVVERILNLAGLTFDSYKWNGY